MAGTGKKELSKSDFKYIPVIKQAPIDMKFHYLKEGSEGKAPTYGIKAKCELVTDINRLKEFAETCVDKIVAVDTETTGLSYKNDYIVGFSISLDSYSGIYVPIRHKVRIATKEQITKRDENGNIMYTKAGKERKQTITSYTYSEQPKNVNAKEALDVLYSIMLNAKKVLLYNSEFDLNMIKKEGYKVRKIKSFDVMILPYVYDPENKKKGLKEVTKLLLGRKVPKFKEVTGSEEGEFQYLDPENGYEYACYDTMGTYGIFFKLRPKVDELLKKYPNPLKIDGKPYNILTNDNRLIKAFVDYYGHTNMLIDNEVAKEYKEKIIRDLATVSARVYPYFGKGQFSLSPSSNDFKRNMEEAQIVTGAYTDTKAISYGKKGIKEFSKNLRNLKEILNKFDGIDFSMGRLDVRNPNKLGKRLADIIKVYHEPYFQISETANALKVKAKDGSKIASDEFLITLQYMLEKETEKLNVLKDIQTISSLNKALNSYIEKLTNVSECKMRYKLMGTSSCRLASGNSSAKKENNDYYIGLNAQNLTKPHACVWKAQQDYGKDHILGWTFEPVSSEFYDEHRNSNEYYFVEGAIPEENIRRCVIAPKGRTIASLDYSGQEVRTIALQSKDRQMLEVLYESDHPEKYPDAVDIHTATAYKIWGKENYTKDLRKRAKACVFATNYGGNEHTIAQNLDIPVDEAREILKGFERVYSEMFQWKAREIDKMYNNQGIVFTPFGRPRQFITRIKSAGDIGKDDAYVSEKILRMVERRVASHQVQGCCGDILRIVLMKLYNRYFKHRDKHIDFLSTIHDEINFTIDDEVLIDYVREIEEIMRFDAFKGKIDIHAGIALGRTFGSCFEFTWADRDKTILVPERL